MVKVICQECCEEIEFFTKDGHGEGDRCLREITFELAFCDLYICIDIYVGEHKCIKEVKGVTESTERGTI